MTCLIVVTIVIILIKRQAIEIYSKSVQAQKRHYEHIDLTGRII